MAVWRASLKTWSRAAREFFIKDIFASQSAGALHDARSEVNECVGHKKKQNEHIILLFYRKHIIRT